MFFRLISFSSFSPFNRKSAKAVVVLISVLGVVYLLTFYQPGNNPSYDYFVAVVYPLQVNEYSISTIQLFSTKINWFILASLRLATILDKTVETFCIISATFSSRNLFSIGNFTSPLPSDQCCLARIVVYTCTTYRNALLQHWTRERGRKTCFRDLGVIRVIKFKTRVFLNKFCPRL